MCLFITAVLPQGARSSAFDAVIARHGLAFRPCGNPHVIAQLKPTEELTLANSGGCDCNSPLFFATRPRIEKQIGKLQAKGWSDAKIKRWVEDSQPRIHQQGQGRGGCWSMADWADFLEEALAQPRVNFVGLIGHWYQGDVENEPFAIKARACHRVSDLRSGALGILDQDTLHIFRVPAAWDVTAAAGP